jgi:hypothetical protein
MVRKVALTTVDNPHDPIDDFPAWFAYDIASGYNTTSFLGRIIVTSDELSDSDQEQAIELAIDEIVRENVSGVHRKIVREVEESELV